MDAPEYCAILQRAVANGMKFPRATKKHMWFQQDGASIHRSKQAKAFFEKQNIPLLDWPAQSPDLNITEHFWKCLLGKLTMHHYDSMDALWHGICMACNEVAQTDDVAKLFESMPRRITAVMKAH